MLIGLLGLGLLFAGCANTSNPSSQPPLPTVAAHIGNLELAAGQVVFVPAYSEMFYGTDQQLIPLTTTLAIHNTDLNHPIIVKSVRYFDTNGKLVREFVDTPLQLAPMGTTGFVINGDDTTAGWGANFMVEWGAETSVYEPVIEAVMVSNRGTEGVSFISEGRVVSEQP